MRDATVQRSAEDERVFEGYRRWGYLAANLDPLGFLTPVEHPELVREGPAAAAARKFYCGTIGAEFVHIDDSVKPALDCRAPGIGRAAARPGVYSGALDSRRSVRAGFAGALPGQQAVFARRRDGAHSAARQRALGGGAGGRRTDRAGHEPPRSPERDGAHCRSARGGYFCRVRGRGPAQRAGQRRRQVSRGRDGGIPHAAKARN